MRGFVVLLDVRPGAPPLDRDRVRALAAQTRAPAGAVTHDLVAGPLQLAWRGGPGARQGVYVDDDVVVVLHGELWLPGDDGRSGTRTTEAAALAAAWRTKGVDLAPRLEGAFVAVVWERRAGVLHVLRDRDGVIPAWWTRADGRLALATAFAPLLDLPWVSRELCREHLAEYLAFRTVHPPRTLLRDVHALAPGHRLRWSGEAAWQAQVWAPTWAAPDTPVPPAAEVLPELEAAIEGAVRRQLAGRERVAVYLSGGAGSAAILAAARAASREVVALTAAFAEEPFPETPFAGRVASLLGMTHRTVTVGSRDIAEHFEDAVADLNHPIGVASVVLQRLLARAAGDADIVLTGDGADQLFGGRLLEKEAAALRPAERWQELPAPVRALLAPLVSRSRRLTALAEPPAARLLREGMGAVRLFDERARRALLLDDSLVHPGVRADVLRPYADAVRTDPLNTILHLSVESWLRADVVPRVERTAAAAGVAVGFPLLDPQVARLAMALPGAFKLRGGGGGALPTRWLLRGVLQGVLPPAMVNRPDRALPHPLDDWLTGAGRLFLEERFALLRENHLGLFHTTGLEALRRQLGRQPGASHRLWSLFVLDAWARGLRLR